MEVGGTHGYGFFSALEYTEGGCLLDKVRTGPLPWTEAVSMARAIASALQYARDRGVVSNDLTAASVLLTKENLPKLVNFRAAASGRGEMLKARSLSPGYAVPEEVSDCEDKESVPATDVYRVGVVLYEMLTGQLPFSGPET